MYYYTLLSCSKGMYAFLCYFVVVRGGHRNIGA
jgi:hypothetical protein